MSRFAGRGGSPEVDVDDYDPSDCWCSQCGRQFNGSDSSGGHCSALTGGCCQNFASLNAFDKHRTGPHDGNRRCLTVAELTAKGWAKTGPHDSWRTPAPATSPWRKDR